MELLLTRRRKLLSWWMIAFAWIFMLLAAGGVAFRVVAEFGITFGTRISSLYGFETADPYSLEALVIFVLILFKGVIGYGMWYEKDWAIKFAIIDAIIGIILTAAMMFIVPMLRMEQDGYTSLFSLRYCCLFPICCKA